MKGATSHMTKECSLLFSYSQFEVPQNVGLGDGQKVQAVGVGTMFLNMHLRNGNQIGTFSNVLYVLKLACNLFSVRATDSKGNVVQFGHRRCWIRNAQGKVIGMGTLVNSLYRLDCLKCKQQTSVTKGNTLELWYQ